ncbi:MAG: biotin--[Oscillospiraceae bacterium]|nr:biotin--[acetyl-CoA-carboxylase] ligase [Oscillospiraceae bacterium]
MLTKIQSFLPEGHLWQNQIIWYDEITSTNDVAKDLIHQGAPHGTVLIADRQSGGRGRMGRSFVSPAGQGVYMSVILRFPNTPEQLMHLTCAAAVAACDAVEAVTGLRPGIKWTNDLVYGGRKLAGILTELVIAPTQTAAVIGIGINCAQAQADFPEDIRSFAGSLSMVCGKSTDRARLAAALIEAFSKMAQSIGEKQAILDTYRRDCVTVGKAVSVVRGDTLRHGTAVGIDDEGALLVEFSDGCKEAVNAGEVSVRGMYGYCP